MDKYKDKSHYLHHSSESRHDQSLNSGRDNELSTTHGSVCHNCGAEIEDGMMFCEECGAAISSCRCPHCQNDIDPGFAICPVCGKPLRGDICSFCGSIKDIGDHFCPECGNSDSGIVCPNCRTLNFRSFCRKCDMPLNDLAMAEIKKAESDPRVKHVRQIAEELAVLEDELLAIQGQTGATGSDASPDTSTALTAKDREILESYRALFGIKATAPIQTPAESEKAPKQETVRRTFQASNNDLQAALSAYRTKAAEMQKALDALIPDPVSPPEQQRNFLSACRFVMVSDIKVKERIKTEWVCNYCGCHHPNPSDCYRPGLGGKWLYREIETTKRKITNNTVNL